MAVAYVGTLVPPFVSTEIVMSVISLSEHPKSNKQSMLSKIPNTNVFLLNSKPLVGTSLILL